MGVENDRWDAHLLIIVLYKVYITPGNATKKKPMVELAEAVFFPARIAAGRI